MRSRSKEIKKYEKEKFNINKIRDRTIEGENRNKMEESK